MVEFVDTILALTALLDLIPDKSDIFPTMYVDLEGKNMSRNGTLSIITLMINHKPPVYLVDVTKLGSSAFSTTDSKDEKSLKTVLESEDIKKVFFDIRNDSSTLFSLYDIKVAGILDLQLMELACRTGGRNLVNGLARCIERDSSMTMTERHMWQTSKEKGKSRFAPERGGSYAVFDERPMAQDIIDYCAQDVQYLPDLWINYTNRLNGRWTERINAEVRKRIHLSQSLQFNSKDRRNAEGPSDWGNLARTPWREMPDPLRFPKGPDEATTHQNPVRSIDTDQTSSVDALVQRINRLEVGSISDATNPAPNSFQAKALEDGNKKAKSAEKTTVEKTENNETFRDRNCYMDNFEDDQRRRPMYPGDLDFEVERDWRSDSTESYKDYTACSADDCGYCGHCDY